MIKEKGICFSFRLSGTDPIMRGGILCAAAQEKTLYGPPSESVEFSGFFCFCDITWVWIPRILWDTESLPFFLLLPAAALLASLAVSAAGFRWRWVFPLCFGASELLLNFLISGAVQGVLLFLLPAAASLIGLGAGALIRRMIVHHRSSGTGAGTSPAFDRSLLEPAIRCSICTGEQVVGFVDRNTGHFQEVALISSEEDLERFLSAWQITRQELKKIY